MATVESEVDSEKPSGLKTSAVSLQTALARRWDMMDKENIMKGRTKSHFPAKNGIWELKRSEIEASTFTLFRARQCEIQL